MDAWQMRAGRKAVGAEMLSLEHSESRVCVRGASCPRRLRCRTGGSCAGAAARPREERAPRSDSVVPLIWKCEALFRESKNGHQLNSESFVCVGGGAALGPDGTGGGPPLTWLALLRVPQLRDSWRLFLIFNFHPKYHLLEYKTVKFQWKH